MLELEAKSRAYKSGSPGNQDFHIALGGVLIGRIICLCLWAIGDAGILMFKLSAGLPKMALIGFLRASKVQRRDGSSSGYKGLKSNSIHKTVLL